VHAVQLALLLLIADSGPPETHQTRLWAFTPPCCREPAQVTTKQHKQALSLSTTIGLLNKHYDYWAVACSAFA